MTLNRPLLQRALKFVEDSEQARLRPEAPRVVWDQEDWAHPLRRTFAPAEVEALSQQELFETCGTAYCVAGFVTSTLPGYSAQITLHPERTYPDGLTGRLVSSLQEFLHGEELFDDESEELSHFHLAMDALGLDHAQADLLFNGDNSAEDVRDFIERFLAAEDALQEQAATL